MQFGRIVRRSAAMYPDRVAFACDGRELTYRRLYERSSQLASGLRELGMHPGDRVATIGDNSLGTAEEIVATALGGFVRCPLYTHNPTESHAYMLNLSGSRTVIAQPAYADAISAARRHAEDLELVISAGGDCSYDEVLARGLDDPNVEVADDDPYIVRFSAGTTGRPKGIMHTNRGWRQMSDEICLALGRLTERDVQVICGPMSHASGLLVWPMIARGATQVICPAFDAGEVLRLLEEHKATTLLVVPTMIQMLADHPDSAKRDLSSLRQVIYTAAPASERTLEEATELFGPVLYQFYGQSETLPLTCLPPEDHRFDGPERRWLRSAGRPTPNSAVRVVDDEGNDVPTGEVGEIVGLSPGAMHEIWRDEQATAERVLPGGWVRTRDVGRLDEDGFLYLADRKEDMIISGGFNIWPAELENALHSHPAVREVAVVGVPHPKWGETPRAVVVLREDATATAAELIDWCKDHVGSVKKPSAVEFRDEPLPKTPIGKVLRRVIRDEYWSDTDRSVGGA